MTSQPRNQTLLSKRLRCVTKVLLLLTAALALLSLTGCKEHLTGILNPKGLITYQERRLLLDAVALMLIVVIPVIIMSFTFVYHYQSSHKTGDYKPNWSHSVFLEAIWWGIPILIILVLGILTYKETHRLDPYRPISGAGKPLLIKVVALPWKWLFIYPEHNIATVNYLQIPRGRQVEFWLTSDNVPMSAFFIPQLGSQIYTMAGSRTKLHLLALENGQLEGLNSQYNGDGFSDMHFKVKVVDPNQMEPWFQRVKRSAKPLSAQTYKALTDPSEGNKPTFYSRVEKDLFTNIINTYRNSVGASHPRKKLEKLGE